MGRLDLFESVLRTTQGTVEITNHSFDSRAREASGVVGSGFDNVLLERETMVAPDGCLSSRGQFEPRAFSAMRTQQVRWIDRVDDATEFGNVGLSRIVGRSLRKRLGEEHRIEQPRNGYVLLGFAVKFEQPRKRAVREVLHGRFGKGALLLRGHHQHEWGRRAKGQLKMSPVRELSQIGDLYRGQRRFCQLRFEVYGKRLCLRRVQYQQSATTAFGQ